MKKIEEYVRSIPDFPEPGIIYRDVTSVLQDADGLQLAVDSMQDCLEGVEFDVITGLESRGFICGMPIAYNHRNVCLRKFILPSFQLPADLLILTSSIQKIPCHNTLESIPSAHSIAFSLPPFPLTHQRGTIPNRRSGIICYALQKEPSKTDSPLTSKGF